MQTLATIVTLAWFIAITYIIYCIFRWVIDSNNGNHQSIYKVRLWISVFIFLILFIAMGVIDNKADDQASNTTNKVPRMTKSDKAWEKKQEKIDEKRAIKRSQLHKKHEKELKAKLSHYPHIQDQLQSMSNNQLFTAQSMIKGNVISWGATSGGSGQILLKDSAGNKFMIEPSTNKGLKGIEDGSTIVAYGSNFEKQKINSSQTNTGIDPSYEGQNVINMPTPDYVKIVSGKGDV